MAEPDGSGQRPPHQRPLGSGAEPEVARRPGVLALALVLAGGLALTTLVRWFWSSADPSADLVVQLKSAERGLTLPIPGEPTPLVSERPSYDRLTVELEPGAKDAWITATLDLEGKLGETQVHSLGFERVHFHRDGLRWTMPEGPAPTLVQAMAALCARRRALEAGSVPALAALAGKDPDQARADPDLALVLAVRERRYAVKGWYLGLERDSAVVSEDYRLTGSTPDRPVDEERTRRLKLARNAHGEFYFAQGLM